ncbi:MAG: hypothetical protein JWL76_971 [Thermoleophilia bacterium]|nr:hypothetical protein [Thermoleophilia bacterium]
MIVTTTPPATPPAAPDLASIAKQFTDIATKLTASDATITTMVTDRSTVGAGWGPHLATIAGEFQLARDGFLALAPKDSAELGAKLGADVLKLSEAAGSLSVMARQRATLSEGWSTFLDTAIADATAAATLLVPPAAPDKPATPPSGPTPPAGPVKPALDPHVALDVNKAFALVQQSIAKIRTVPTSDKGDASTKDARIAAFNLNMEAQKVLEGHFSTGEAGLTSALRGADAHLEDANWQLAKKPSPDGRFNGVDIPGALRDSQAAADALVKLVNPSGVQVDPLQGDEPAPVRSAIASGTTRLQDPVGQPGDIDYCQTPAVLAKTRPF